MSRSRLVGVFTLIALWALVIMPSWVIGIGFEASGFRMPSPFRDTIADNVLVYLPMFILMGLVSLHLLRHPREGGDPYAQTRENMDSRLRGNDE